MKLWFTFWTVWCFGFSTAQSIDKKVQLAIQLLEKDSSMRHALVGICILDAKTGKQLFAKNEQLGMAPASCQKVITSVAAMELLGVDFRYTTQLKMAGTHVGNQLKGNLIVRSNGDPSLGSWRYDNTTETVLLNQFSQSLKKKGIQKITGQLVVDETAWPTQRIPNGWIWEDIANYYGAGAGAFNWRENQFDVVLRSGEQIGSNVKLVSTQPALKGIDLVSELTAAEKSSGDNAYLYFDPPSDKIIMRGSIPVGEKAFEISGAMPNPAQQFEHSFLQQLQKDKIDWIPNSEPERFSEVLLYEHQSPNLDSLNYWFLHKSINLYGEAFLKTIGWQQMAKAATSAGIEAIKQFWQAKSISPHALNLHDGSGLSPQNRITCQALAQVMQYARSTPFFLRFRDDLPEINGLKMKDGYINGVRSYTGYCKSKTGSEYTFAFIINNFSGSAAQARIKMWKIIDLLK